MGNGFWAGDSIATSIQSAGDRARANATLAQQQAYHAGDILLQRAALAALAAIDQNHPLLVDLVQLRIEELGQNTFYKSGWKQACSLEVDPHQVFAELQAKHEQDKRRARQGAEAQAVEEKRRGIPLLTRRTVYTWFDQEYPTRTAAEQAKALRLASIDRAQLGDL